MARSFIRGLVASLLMLGPGCNILKLPSPLHPGELDTPTFGRTAVRMNTIPVNLSPPLTLSWQQDVTAGIGSGSLLLVDSTLFVGNLRGELYALSVLTGKRYGWVSLGGSIEGAPVVDRELAIVPLAGSRASLIGYDLVNARIRWQAELGDLHGSLLLMDTHVFAGNTQGAFFAVDELTGNVLWRFELPHNTALKGIRSSAAGWSNHVVFGADDGAVYDLDAATGAVRWRYAVDGAIQASASIADSSVFVGTLKGTVYALRLADGTLRWSHSSGSSIYAPPLVQSGLCIFGTTGGMVLALDQSTGATVWSCDIHSPINSGILGANNVLYLGTLKKELIALDPVKGSIVWRETVSGRIKTTPIAWTNRLIIATDERLIQAYAGSGQ
jgi:eukaryotic-like serine/threonine-protein kinase